MLDRKQVIAAGVLGSILLLGAASKKPTRRTRPRADARPRIVMDGCEFKRIPSEWNLQVAAPKYESLFEPNVVPDDFVEAVDFLTANILAGEVPDECLGDGAPDSAKALSSTISDKIAEGLAIGVNPFRVVMREALPGAAKPDLILVLRHPGGKFFAATNENVAWPPSPDNAPLQTAPTADTPQQALSEMKFLLEPGDNE